MSTSKPVVWFEVMGRDLDALHGFYRELFDWKIQPMDAMPYGLVDKAGEGIPGGVGAVSGDRAPYVTFYVEVDDVEAALKRAEGLGGKVLMPPTELPSTTIGMFADPEGNPIGLSSSAQA